MFRSTAYHSTVEVDSVEQNSTDEHLPFAIGNEARLQVLEWQQGLEIETLEAEHNGYQRLPRPVAHKRRVVFNKLKRYWFVTDTLTGEGEHTVSFRFHFASGLDVAVRPDGQVEVRDGLKGARLLIHASELNVPGARPPELEHRFSSCNYGKKEPSVSACWSVRTALPLSRHFAIVPICPGEDEVERLSQAIDFEG